MKKKLFYGSLIFALIAINVTLSESKFNDQTSYSLAIKNVQAQAQNEGGVPACYSSMEYNGGLMPGNYYEVILGETCYQSGTACGKEQSCSISGRGDNQNYCYDLNC
jgi:hypothetical protein